MQSFRHPDGDLPLPEGFSAGYGRRATPVTCIQTALLRRRHNKGRRPQNSKEGPSPGKTLYSETGEVTETVEFSVSYSSEKGVPFVRVKAENRAFGVLAVANADVPAGKAGYLDAVAVREAKGTLDPVRISLGAVGR
jgi:hypothetical protein